MEPNNVLFREVQRFRQIWIWIIVIFMMVLSWYSVIQQIVLKIPFGTQPAPDPIVIGMWILFGLAFPGMLFMAGLITEVRGDGIYVRFIPFHRQFRTMQYAAIQTYEARTYRPLREYGGWGIRFGPWGKAYNVRGNRGVQLVLQSGQKILIGSQRPEELVLAIDRARGMTHEGDPLQNR